MPAQSLPFEPARRFRSAGNLGGDVLADCQGRRIAVLIVAYNAAAALLRVWKRIPPVVWRNVEEVVLLDDASREATSELTARVKTPHDLAQLTVLKHPSSWGYGGNQKAGCRYLIERGFDIVVLAHGDGQYARELPARMYAPLVLGETAAVPGSRMTKKDGGPLKGGMPLYKFAGNGILAFLENRTLDMRLTEFHSGSRAYSVEALKQIAMDRTTDDFHFDTKIIIKFRHQGFRIVEVPIPAYYGKGLCYGDGMRYTRKAVGAAWRYRGYVNAIRSCPEFEEYWRNYPLKEARHSSHSLVQGADRGIVDRTHVRFYTRRTGRQLLDENGVEVTSTVMSVMPVELVLGLAPRSQLMRVLPALLAAVTRLVPGLLGYQTIYAARCKHP